MNYYVVEHVLDRRVREDDGAIEYKIHWKGYDSEQGTWEPRSNLLESCTEAIQKIDQRQIEYTDKCIEAWRCGNGLVGDPDIQATNREESKTRKRGRSVEPHTGRKDDLETLSCLLLRYKSNKASSISASPARRLDSPMPALSPGPDASIILLGEMILTEQTVSLLYTRRYAKNMTTSHRRRRMEGLRYCAPAQHLERAWKEKFAVSLMHSCMGCDAITKLQDNFASATSSAITRDERGRAGDLEILGIAPPEVTLSGHVYAKPVTFIPWIGEEEAERLRRESVAGYPALTATSQDLMRPHSEGTVVRYAITENVSEVRSRRMNAKERSSDSSEAGAEGDCESKTGTQKTPLRVISSMPLSVFRVVFPQLLIDYLLEHSVVLQAT
ncbi:unnamed protein product [Phytomonas sp. Hart1]|nr:unnamed protein product [Phytomonas sp. Hart1]|eukprot:CCW69790.1 unnamed protein product [Phytomonas sp. isolate Hart1]